jgi:lipoic acid synthetase
VRNITDKSTETSKKNSKPVWLKRKIPSGENFFRLKKDLESNKLFTICQSARCPNISECWNEKNATFLIMGDICTRNCHFCSVSHGTPRPLDPLEPQKILQMANLMQLKHLVMTSVTRDDLPDGGSSHFSAILDTLKKERKNLTVEVLIPDFNANPDHLNRVLMSRPDVVNHNLETVRSQYPKINRKPENYDKSLTVLHHCFRQGFITKSGIMVGLGETRDEIDELFDDLLSAGVKFLTVGQYLQPTRQNLPVSRYVTPDEFRELKSTAVKMGFKAVEAGPFVRSSYHARSMVEKYLKLYGQNVSHVSPGPVS